MADVRIIDNATRQAGDELTASLEWATEIRIASAFATKAALTKILSPMEKMLARGGSVTVMYGLDCHVTDPEVIEQLHQLASSYSTVKQYVHLNWADAVNQTFHTKLYIAIGGEHVAQVLIGSSKLTKAGLWRNTEANALLRGSLKDEAIQDACEIFTRIRQEPAFVIPDEQVIADYRRLRSRATSLPVGPRPPEELADSYKALENYVKTLPSVWADDVHSRVHALVEESEASDFTLKEFNRRFEQELADLHPKNQHVQPKIRQQLQVLRDKNVLDFLGRGRYRVRQSPTRPR
ncbi:MAG: phospholipase D-like domain-containing protein [Chloroflexota bacterium]|nr:phospholipase D-like domain-containing protein [Chloroflexota bacterium]